MRRDFEEEIRLNFQQNWALLKQPIIRLNGLTYKRDSTRNDVLMTAYVGLGDRYDITLSIHQIASMNVSDFNFPTCGSCSVKKCIGQSFMI